MRMSEYVNHKNQKTNSSYKSATDLNKAQEISVHQEPVDLAYYYYYQNEDTSRFYAQTKI